MILKEYDHVLITMDEKDEPLYDLNGQAIDSKNLRGDFLAYAQNKDQAFVSVQGIAFRLLTSYLTPYTH